MPRQRGYQSSCGIAHALDLVGERWALLIVRELIHGPRRFSDLRRELPTASPNAISDRLRELTDVGVVRRHQLGAPAGSWVYELTEWGAGLGPILVSLGDWGLGSSTLDPDAYLSLGSVMLTFRTYYRGGFAGTIQVDMADAKGIQEFSIEAREDAARTFHGAPESADAVISGTARAMIDAIGPDGDTAGVHIIGDSALAAGVLRNTRVR